MMLTISRMTSPTKWVTLVILLAHLHTTGAADGNCGSGGASCFNGGRAICARDGTFVSCNCTEGYSGTYCQIADACYHTRPCRNGATCNSMQDSYNCTCTPGFSGTNCATAENRWQITYTIRISDRGSDVDQCGSANDPCATLSHVLTNIPRPREVVLALEGGYSYHGCSNLAQSQSFLSGAVVLTSYNGRATLIDCHLGFANSPATTQRRRRQASIIPDSLLSVEDIDLYSLSLVVENDYDELPRIYIRDATIQGFEMVHDESSCSNLQLDIIDSELGPRLGCLDDLCFITVPILSIFCENVITHIQNSRIQAFIHLLARRDSQVSLLSASFINSQGLADIDMGLLAELGDGDSHVLVDGSSFSEIVASPDVLEVKGALTVSRIVTNVGRLFRRAADPSNEQDITIWVQNSNFSDNDRGMSLLLRGRARVNVLGTDFHGNVAAGPGGALLFSQRHDIAQLLPDDIGEDDVFTARVADCLFSGNDATGIWKYSSALDRVIQHQGSGGAIFMNVQSLLGFDASATTLELSSNVFENNSAETAGGAYYLGPYVVAESSDNSLSNSFLHRHALFGDLIYATGQLSFSGDAITLATADSRSSVIHFRNPYTAFLSLLGYTLECPFGYFIETHSSNNPITSNQYDMEAFYQFCKGCPSGTFPFITANLIYNVVTAGDGSRTVESDLTEVECFACPYGATCDDGRIRALTDFWGTLRPQTGVAMHRCPQGYCCPAGECGTYNECAEHRVGPLCGRCEVGFTESIFSPVCIPDADCISSWWSWIIPLIILSLIYVTYLLFEAEIAQLLSEDAHKLLRWCRERRTLRRKPRKETDVHGGLLDVFFFFIQTAALLKVDIVHRITNREQLESTSETVEGILSLEFMSFFKEVCLFTGIEPITKQFARSGFVLVMFAILMLMALVYQVSRAGGACSSRGGPRLCGRPTRRASSTRIIVAFLLLFLYTYQILAEVSFLLVQCVSVDGDNILYIDGNISCYQTWHFSLFAFIFLFVVPFFIPMTFAPYLLFKRVISMPVFLLSLILPLPLAPYVILKRVTMESRRTEAERRRRHRRQERGGRGCCQTSSATITEVCSVLMGPFRGNLKANICWEGIIVFRRLILIILVTFIRSPILRLSAVCGALLIMLIVQVLVQPFQRRISHTLETVSLGVLNIIAALNLVKATFLEFENIPGGYMALLFLYSDWVELIAAGIIPILIVLIINVVIVFWFIRNLPNCWKFDFRNRNPFDDEGGGRRHRRQREQLPIGHRQRPSRRYKDDDEDDDDDDEDDDRFTRFQGDHFSENMAHHPWFTPWGDPTRFQQVRYRSDARPHDFAFPPWSPQLARRRGPSQHDTGYGMYPRVRQHNFVSVAPEMAPHWMGHGSPRPAVRPGFVSRANPRQYDHGWF